MLKEGLRKRLSWTRDLWEIQCVYVCVCVCVLNKHHILMHGIPLVSSLLPCFQLLVG